MSREVDLRTGFVLVDLKFGSAPQMKSAPVRQFVGGGSFLGLSTRIYRSPLLDAFGGYRGLLRVLGLGVSAVNCL